MWWMWMGGAAAQVVENPSLEPLGVVAEVPNPVELEVPGWTLGGTGGAGVQAQVAAVGVEVYCDDVIVHDSSINVASGYLDRHFVYAEAVNQLPISESNEWVSTTVTGLTAGEAYLVRFEASCLRHVGQSPGYWQVTFDGSTQDSDILALPKTTPAQLVWVDRAVGPFVASGPSAQLTFEATSTGQDTGFLPVNACGVGSGAGVAQLLLDGVQVVGDQDGDGVFDDEDPCPALAGPASDQDDDGLSDAIEGAYGTDPCNPDSDGDSWSDGDEVSMALDNEHGLACPDPTNEDSDGDGVLDADEAVAYLVEVIPCDLGTTEVSNQPTDTSSDPCHADTDGDGWNDATERAAGTHWALADTDGDLIDDDRDPEPTDCTVHCTDDAPWLDDATQFELERCCDEGWSTSCEESEIRKFTSGQLIGGRCGCATPSGAPWWWALAPGLLWIRRRSPPAT